MSMLDETVQELYQKEPYWNICNPCKCKGHCCIGADISASEEEWHRIQKHVKSLSNCDFTIIEDNILNSRYCIFRSDEKCLIHSVRPDNCRYTPYQYVVTPDNFLNYSQVRVKSVGEECEYRSVHYPLTDSQASVLREKKFAPLPNYEETVLYLSLYWHVYNEGKNPNCCLVSEWIQKEPLTR